MHTIWVSTAHLTSGFICLTSIPGLYIPIDFHLLLLYEMLFLLMLLPCIAGVAIHTTDEDLRLSYGVVFHPTADKFPNIEGIIETKFILHLPTPSERQTLPPTDNLCLEVFRPECETSKQLQPRGYYSRTRDGDCPPGTETVDRMAEQEQLCLDLQRQILTYVEASRGLDTQIDMARKNIVDMTNMISTRPRRRRTLFDLSGFTKIFGVASDADLQALFHRVQELETAYGEFGDSETSLFNKLETLSNTTNVRIKQLYNIVDMQTTHMSNLSDTIVSMRDSILAMDKITLLGYRVQQVISIQLAKITQLTYVLAQQNNELNRLTSFHEGLTSILLGRLSPKLVSTTELRKALNKILEWANTNNVKAKPLMLPSQIHLYYEATTTTAFKHKDSLFILVKVPMSTTNKNMKIYKIERYPVISHGRNSLSQPGYTLLKSNKQFLAVTHNDLAYKFLTSHDLLNCRSVFQPYCPSMASLIPSSHPTCEWGLFMNNRQIADKYCDHLVYPDFPPASLKEISPRKYMFTSMAGKISIHCRLQVSYVTLSNQSLLEIPCLCSATNEHVLIPEQYCKHDVDVTTPISQHIVSWPLLKLFNYTHVMISPLNELSPNNPTIPDVPDLSTMVRNVARMREYDTRAGVALSTLMQERPRHRVTEFTDLNISTTDMSYTFYYLL